MSFQNASVAAVGPRWVLRAIGPPNSVWSLITTTRS